MNLFCVGLSHHVASVDVLERFGGDTELNALRQLGCDEALLLRTCNRVEIYGAADRVVATAQVAAVLQRQRHDAAAPEFYRHEGADCVRHIFRVASGLDSMVIGETEILGQVKKAYESARAAGTAGAYLHRLFQRTFRVAKQVRSHTGITRGAVSVGSVAVDLAQKIFGNLANCKALVLGAGETSERTARALASRGVRDVRVSNRSAERGEELARAIAARAVAFAAWPEQCAEVDIVITATAAPEPLLRRDALEPILRERIDRPLFIIDIAVPRDVDPAVDELDGVYLYDIDSLQAVAQQSLAQRRQQIAAAEEIIGRHVGEFTRQIGRGLQWQSRGADHPPVTDGSLRASEL